MGLTGGTGAVPPPARGTKNSSTGGIFACLMAGRSVRVPLPFCPNKKSPLWGAKRIPPPDRPQESVDVTRIPAPGAKMPGSSRRFCPPMTRAANHARLRRLGTAGIFPFRGSGLFPVRTKSYYTKPEEKSKGRIAPGGKNVRQVVGCCTKTDKLEFARRAGGQVVTNLVA